MSDVKQNILKHIFESLTENIQIPIKHLLHRGVL